MYNIKTLAILFVAISFPLIINAQINAHDAQNRRHGKWQKNYENTGKIRYKGQFEHGKEVGTFKFYDKSSDKHPVATKTYLPKSDSISVKFYTPKGKLVSEGKMIGRKKEGKWRYYHKNNQQLMMLENYKNDLLHGWKEIYFPNGKVAEKQHFSKGKADGKNFVYGKNGQLIQEYTYKNGKFHGPVKIYDANGNLKTEGNYKNGLKTGTWKYYKNGNIEDTEQHP